MAAHTDEVRGAVKRLAEALLDDSERIAGLSVSRMQELLPSYARVPREAVMPVTLTNTRHLLEALCDPDADPSRAEDYFRVSGENRARQGVTADEMLQAWRIGVEVLREEAHPVADRLEIADDVLLEFVEASLRWSDVGMRRSASAYREAEIRELERLAAEQAALRRVATLVAQGVPSRELFSAVAREIGTVFGADFSGILRYEPDPSIVTTMATWAAVGEHPPAPGRSRTVPGDPTSMVADTGQPARVDDWTDIPGPIAAFVRRELGVRSSVGSPIVVEGRLWGALAVHSKHGPLPSDTETRLLKFTELMATAIANTNARAEVSRLADEQAALRRVATLVASGATPEVVFGAVADEVHVLFGADISALVRFEADGTATVMADRGGPHALGARVKLDQGYVVASVRDAGRAARFDTDDPAAEDMPGIVRTEGIRSALASPVVVNGRVWGAVTAATVQAQPMPADAESRIAQFTELLATAVSNIQARSEVGRLAEEQAALRHVATLVASGLGPEVVFHAVAYEVYALWDADVSHVVRFEEDGIATVMGAHGGPHSAGARIWIDPGFVVASVRETGRSARFDTDDAAAAHMPDVVREMGIHSGVACPIIVAGRLWGAVVAARSGAQPMPADGESRIAQFTELVATAISNVQSREEVERLADEQAALRRVATMVARESSPEEIFSQVAQEVALLLGVEAAVIQRYEDGYATVVGDSGRAAFDSVLTNEFDPFRVGTRLRMEGDSVTALVSRTGLPARFDSYDTASGSMASNARTLGLRSAVGSPIIVNGRLWGAIVAATSREEPMPADAESRIAEFTELLATAISNAQARSDLAASRARVVATADEERRRVVRDLHDGAQQRLVHTVMTLKLARRELDSAGEQATQLVDEALQHAETATDELRELAHGILPSILTHGGLRAGVRALASRMSIPLEIEVSVDRLPQEVEATAYFIVAEALTNVAKHSNARGAKVTAHLDSRALRVEVRDDGVGGAQPEGTGLVGLRDRLAVLGGSLQVDSPRDGGTLIAASIPVVR